MSKQTVRKSKKLLSPKAGALSRPSHKIRVPPTCEIPQTNNGLIIRAELPAHAINQNNNLDINTLLRIEKVASI